MVTAVPFGLPFNVKLIVLPLTPVPPEVSVADMVVVPPYTPVDGWAVSVVALALATAASTKFCTVVDPALTVTSALAVA